MKDIKVIIFDFDGVLIDSGSDIASSMQHTLKVFNRPVLSREKIISYVGNGAGELLRRCFGNCDEQVIKEALPYYKEYYLKNAIVETKLYDNVKEVLEHLHTIGKKIALVTNKPEALTLKILGALDIRRYFGEIAVPEYVKNIKPHPEGLLKVIEGFGEKPENTVMVGDSNIDIEAGKSAGTYTCGVTYGLGDREALINSEPDVLIKDIKELLWHIV